MEWAWLNNYDLHPVMWFNDLFMTSSQISCISNSCWSGVYFSAIMSHCTYSNCKAWNIFQCGRAIYGTISVMILHIKWPPRREKIATFVQTPSDIYDIAIKDMRICFQKLGIFPPKSHTAQPRATKTVRVLQISISKYHTTLWVLDILEDAI